MAFCKHCGVYLATGISTCPSCGTPVDGGQKSADPAGGSAAQQAEDPWKQSSQKQRREPWEEPGQKNGQDKQQSSSYHYSYRRGSNRNRDTHTGYDAGGAWQPHQDHSSSGSASHNNTSDRQNTYGYDNSRPPPYVSAEEADAQANRGMAALSYLSLLFLVPLLLRPKSPFCRFHANQGLLLFLLWIVGRAIFSIGFFGWVAGVVIWCVGIYGFFSGIGAALRGQKRELPIIGSFRLIK